MQKEAMKAASLSCSIVVYRSRPSVLGQTITSFSKSVDRARGINVDQVQLILVNNDPWATEESTWALLPKTVTYADSLCIEVICGHGNVGYGKGHNLAIARSDKPYHLILNPDVVLAEDALVEAVGYLESNRECGLVAAKAFGGEGQIEYLCKRYPTVLDLVLRGFAPTWVQKLFRKRLYHYEMRDAIGDNVILDVPIVSGCFMLFRRSVLAQLGGFSRDYFLYFEDFDLSLRANRITDVAYVPKVQIVHFGGQAARKGWRHVAMFVRSAITFFNQHGWKWW